MVCTSARLLTVFPLGVCALTKNTTVKSISCSAEATPIVALFNAMTLAHITIMGYSVSHYVLCALSLSSPYHTNYLQRIHDPSPQTSHASHPHRSHPAQSPVHAPRTRMPIPEPSPLSRTITGPAPWPTISLLNLLARSIRQQRAFQRRSRWRLIGSRPLPSGRGCGCVLGHDERGAGISRAALRLARRATR